jgi:hypothetical protein
MGLMFLENSENEKRDIEGLYRMGVLLPSLIR